MKKFALCLLTICAITLVVTPTFAAEQATEQTAGQVMVETVITGCKSEIESYCAGVTPGKSRVLACLYANEDKLSGKCEYALYDAAAQLERAVGALKYVVYECIDDLRKHCSAVKKGQGRLLRCIEDNDAQVSEQCKQAIETTGLKSK